MSDETMGPRDVMLGGENRLVPEGSSSFEPGLVGEELGRHAVSSLRSVDQRVRLKALKVLGGREADFWARNEDGVEVLIDRCTSLEAEIVAESDLETLAWGYFQVSTERQKELVKVVEILEDIDYPQVTEVLLRLSHSVHPEVRRVAVGPLAKKKSLEALTRLVEMADTGDQPAKAKALGYLEEVSWIEALPILLRALKQAEDNMVRQAAAWALRHYSDEGVEVDLIAALKQDESDYVKQSAANTLGELRIEGAVEPLWQFFEEKNGDVYAAKALGQIGGEAVLNKFLGCLDVLGTRAYCALVGLGELRDSRATERILQLTELDLDRVFKMEVVEVLGRIGDERAADYLLACLDDGNTDVVKKAIAAAVEMGLVAAREKVLRLFRAGDLDKGVPEQAAWALGIMGDEEGGKAMTDWLVQRLENRFPDYVTTEEMVIWALGRLGDSRALGVLERVIRGEGSRFLQCQIEAVKALARIGTPESMRVLEMTALEHESESLRQEARRQLSEAKDDVKGSDPLIG